MSGENHTMPVREVAAALLLVALALTACENVPYYDDSLNWFSRSRYDPEVKAIEDRTPPAQDSPVLEPGGDGASAGPLAGGAILPAASLENEAPHAGPDQVDVTSASLAPRQRIAPPMGFARSKRVIYGGNRGPFQTGTMRTLR